MSNVMRNPVKIGLLDTIGLRLKNKMWRVRNFPGRLWDWVIIKHEVLRFDGEWTPYGEFYDDSNQGDSEDVYEYLHVNRSGEQQRRTVLLSVSRVEWRIRCLKWLPCIRKRAAFIEVEFDEAVGTSYHSCIAYRFEMKRHESPIAALRRMEREKAIQC